MGNCKSNNQFQNIINQYEMRKDLFKDNRFGMIRVLYDRKLKQEVFLKELSFVDQKEYQQNLLQLNKVKEQSSPYILRVVNIFSQNEQQFCSPNSKIYALCEYSKETLNEKINLKSHQRDYFSEIEMFQILHHTINGLAQLQQQKQFHGEIRPDNIFIHYGYYKIVYNQLIGQIQGIQKTQTNDFHEMYDSPELFTMYNKNQFNFQKMNLFKSDVFSLGLSMVHAGTLSSQRDIYNRAISEIDFGKLYRRVEDLRDRYSDRLVNIIKLMLEKQEEYRPDFSRLYNMFISDSDGIKDYLKAIGYVNMINETPLQINLPYTPEERQEIVKKAGKVVNLQEKIENNFLQDQNRDKSHDKSNDTSHNSNHDKNQQYIQDIGNAIQHTFNNDIYDDIKKNQSNVDYGIVQHKEYDAQLDEINQLLSKYGIDPIVQTSDIRAPYQYKNPEINKDPIYDFDKFKQQYVQPFIQPYIQPSYQPYQQKELNFENLPNITVNNNIPSNYRQNQLSRIDEIIQESRQLRSKSPVPQRSEPYLDKEFSYNNVSNILNDPFNNNNTQIISISKYDIPSNIQNNPQEKLETLKKSAKRTPNNIPLNKDNYQIYDQYPTTLKRDELQAKEIDILSSNFPVEIKKYQGNDQNFTYNDFPNGYMNSDYYKSSTDNKQLINDDLTRKVDEILKQSQANRPTHRKSKSNIDIQFNKDNGNSQITTLQERIKKIDDVIFEARKSQMNGLIGDPTQRMQQLNKNQTIFI